MVTDKQVRRLMRLIKTEKTRSIAGMDEKTVLLKNKMRDKTPLFLTGFIF
ncbi:MAG: hypothetical protein ACUZ8E_12590 [Candidatus Anammoxibacter sp.]